MARPSQPDFQKKSSPSPIAAPSQAMAPRPFPPQADVAAPDVQAPDVAAPDALTLDSPPAFPKLNFHIRTAGGSHPPLQPKLTIGAPNDPYEQEADRVAEQVVQRIHLPAANLPTQNRTYQAQSVQRQAWPEQPVLEMKPTLQRETLLDKDDELQMKPMLQRLEMPEEDELQMKPMPQRSEMPPGVKLQMKSAFSEGAVEGDASPDLEAGIQRARGNGQALAPALQMQMGQAMGADFSGVRVHTDTQSDQLNRSIQAKAFTTGQDIFFRQGAYQPENRGSQELIAHELTHVVQQNGKVINRYLDAKSQHRIQPKNGATPQNFAVTGANVDNAHCAISTVKTWQSSTGSLGDLDDIEMREVVTFNHNPAIDMPSYPIVIPSIPNMTLVGNVLTKVAGAMQNGSGTDNHQGAGYGPTFTHGPIQNLTKGLWTLVGQQVYEYRDRTAKGPWTPLHNGHFVLTRDMAINPATHQYELTFSKVGPGCNASVTTPITMQTSEAMQAVGAAHPDQAGLWGTLQAAIANQEHDLASVRQMQANIRGQAISVDFQITSPNFVRKDPMLAPFETITQQEYDPG